MRPRPLSTHRTVPHTTAMRCCFMQRASYVLWHDEASCCCCADSNCLASCLLTGKYFLVGLPFLLILFLPYQPIACSEWRDDNYKADNDALKLPPHGQYRLLQPCGRLIGCPPLIPPYRGRVWSCYTAYVHQPPQPTRFFPLCWNIAISPHCRSHMLF